MRWPNGFQCPRCAHERAYKIRTRKFPLYECCQCNYQTTVLVGTIFEKTRTDLRKWFWAIYLVAHDKRGVSARFIADELEVCYDTAWTMPDKIRKAMEKRDAFYQIGGSLSSTTLFSAALQQAASAVGAQRKAKCWLDCLLMIRVNPSI